MAHICEMGFHAGFNFGTIIVDFIHINFTELTEKSGVILKYILVRFVLNFF